MITNSNAAKQISEVMWEILGKIQESLEGVKQTCPPEEYETFNRAVGEIVAPIMFKVLEPLYKENPTLKPAGWDS